MLLSGVVPEIELLRLRDPNAFVAGGIHANSTAWEVILSGYPAKERLLNWIRNKVDIFEFCKSFSGVYKNSQYCSDLPPAKRLPNHGSCDKFTDFICEEILKRVSSGTVRVWGRVGIVSPPRLILPLTVEPSKPRLGVDARFLNLWMKDVPFSLDKITDVPGYVYHGSYMTKCDDKSGYDHVLLTSDSQAYFGFEWGGLWFVCRTLPFGWKISPFIYHSIGLAVSSFLRDQGIPCSLYIDERLNGELLTQSGPWPVLCSDRLEEFRFKAAQATLFCCPVWFGRAWLHASLCCTQPLLWSIWVLSLTLKGSRFWYRNERLFLGLHCEKRSWLAVNLLMLRLCSAFRGNVFHFR